MDPPSTETPDSANTSKLEDQIVLSSFDQSLNPPNCDKDERSNKQSAEDVELSEIFDMVLLCTYAKGKKDSSETNSEISSKVEKSPKGQETKNAAADLRTLLISCAQSVAAGDQDSASEKLKQIRQASSPTGDADQRLASVFADGLEARLTRSGAKGDPIEYLAPPLRLAGTGVQQFAALPLKRMTDASDKIKAYHVHLSACPFIKVSISFANKMIFHAACNATTLHIIDFVSFMVSNGRYSSSISQQCLVDLQSFA